MSTSATSETTLDTIYQELRRLLVEGHYSPGEHLVEGRLANDLGVSRTPVRQALARAAAEGLVKIYPNRGAVVRTFTHDDLVDAYNLRAVLEGYAAHEAALHITATQLAQLEEHAAALESIEQQVFASREEEIHFLVNQNQQFHDIIIAASSNQRLADLLPLVVNVPLQFRCFYWYSSEERRESNFFHRSILCSLHAGAPERARTMMQEHIYRGRDSLLRNLAQAAKL